MSFFEFLLVTIGDAIFAMWKGEKEDQARDKMEEEKRKSEKKENKKSPQDSIKRPTQKQP